VPKDDVAVLTLRYELSPTYPTISLSAQGDQTPYAEGTTATIVGYGIPDDNGNPGTLRVATVPIASDATCTSSYGNSYDPTRMTCAGDPAHNGSDTCGGDSGGPLVVAGVEVGITDWGPASCGSFLGVYERLSTYHDSITADFVRTPILNLDWTGDGHTDLFTRDKSGNLFLYSGSGFTADGTPPFSAWGKVGAGWNFFNKLFRIYNWWSNRLESVIGETPGGDLWIYNEDFQGNFNPGLVIGSGWGAFSDIMVTNNWNGDGKPNLLARTPSGDLWIYNSNGSGGWLNPAGTRIGTGWGAFDTILTPGNWTGSAEGFPSLIGRTPGGDLFLYTSDGHGGWSNGAGTRIGTGWNGFKIFQSPGDINGDDMMDVIGITPGGGMFLYTTNGHGGWITGVGQQIGAGWQIYNRVF
jgi:hypothetical protein